MTAVTSNTQQHAHLSKIEIADASLVFRPVRLDDRSPTGQQIAAIAGFAPNQNAVVLQVLANGELENVRSSEVIDLSGGIGRFVVMESDRTYYLYVDGVCFEWPCRIISGATLRKFANVGHETNLFFEQKDVADQLIEFDSLLDLNAPGSERFYSQPSQWRLNVQNVHLDVEEPTIIVRDALIRANFDPERGWEIFLKVAGQPKQSVGLDAVIDLRTPGIEKLRLIPREINNGEGAIISRRDFALLEADERFLDAANVQWQTVLDSGRRWLLISNYPIPEGYTVKDATIALDVPPSYPGAQIDMFYCHPSLVLTSGACIPATEVQEAILGIPHQRWSRHRGIGASWNPASDNIITHLALVDSALLKEAGQ